MGTSKVKKCTLRKIIFCIGLTRAAKAGQKSFIGRQVQLTHQGRTRIIWSIWVPIHICSKVSRGYPSLVSLPTTVVFFVFRRNWPKSDILEAIKDSLSVSSKAAVAKPSLPTWTSTVYCTIFGVGQSLNIAPPPPTPKDNAEKLHGKWHSTWTFCSFPRDMTPVSGIQTKTSGSRSFPCFFYLFFRQ